MADHYDKYVAGVYPNPLNTGSVNDDYVPPIDAVFDFDNFTCTFRLLHHRLDPSHEMITFPRELEDAPGWVDYDVAKRTAIARMAVTCPKHLSALVTKYEQ